MISEKVMSVAVTLGVLAGQVSPDVWDTLACARRELLDAAAQALALETHTIFDAGRRDHG
jgi:LmbE family N-acetylglucosaminyl deacetylase